MTFFFYELSDLIEGFEVFVQKDVELVPFELESDDEIDNIVDVGDGSDETGENFFGRRIVHDATAGLGGDTRPPVNVFVALFSEDFRHLAHDDFLTAVNTGRKAEEGVD